MSIFKKTINWNRGVVRWLERQFPSIFGEQNYKNILVQMIQDDLARNRPSVVLEVGGIDRPLLQRDKTFTYIGIDIDDKPACSLIYDSFVVQSIDNPLAIKADMIVSITLMEHVPNNTAATGTIFKALNPGGTTHHYIPSKWHPYSAALRLVGPTLQKRLIAHLRPGTVEVTGCPAFFDHCSPNSMVRLFAGQGSTEIDLRCFYRASDYFSFFLPAYLIVVLFEIACAVLGLRFFASGFIISARRPVAQTGTLK